MSAPTSPAPTRTAGKLYQHPRFLRVWASQSAGAVADQILPVAFALYAVHRGAGAGTIAVILAGRAVALVVCLLAGGILADRVSRPRILFTADVLRAAVVLGALLTLDRLPLAALGIVTALSGAAEALSRPAMRSLIPALLPSGLLERGNALVAAVQRSATLAGALAGAAIVAAVGIHAALGLAAVLFGTGALAVLGVRDATAARARTSVLADAAAGIDTVRRRPWVLAVMGAVAVQLFAGTAPTLTLLPLVAAERLGGELAYGVVLGALAAGALPAIAVASRWRPRHPGAVSMLALTSYAALPASLAFALPLPVTALCFAAGGFAVELYFIYWLSALQREIPAEVLGKTLALDQLSAFALLPVGYALTGPAVAALGARPTLVVAAVLTAVASAAALLVPGVSAFRDPVQPAARDSPTTA
ncbi:MFS transporter [Micromonospora sp. KC723]|uniref:MFS transporter n=1 Tax=Micromonospora sp. KC723 TaxID=2530381 RepID=UPI001043901E|nr:MFS transporter [Micromonospora sp. KC723]TDB76950.1 MFS transporter [Micromonospora sp. KC723]